MHTITHILSTKQTQRYITEMIRTNESTVKVLTGLDNIIGTMIPLGVFLHDEYVMLNL